MSAPIPSPPPPAPRAPSPTRARADPSLDLEVRRLQRAAHREGYARVMRAVERVFETTETVRWPEVLPLGRKTDPAQSMDAATFVPTEVRAEIVGLKPLYKLYFADAGGRPCCTCTDSLPSRSSHAHWRYMASLHQVRYYDLGDAQMRGDPALTWVMALDGKFVEVRDPTVDLRLVRA